MNPTSYIEVAALQAALGSPDGKAAGIELVSHVDLGGRGLFLTRGRGGRGVNVVIATLEYGAIGRICGICYAREERLPDVRAAFLAATNHIGAGSAAEVY